VRLICTWSFFSGLRFLFEFPILFFSVPLLPHFSFSCVTSFSFASFFFFLSCSSFPSPFLQKQQNNFFFFHSSPSSTHQPQQPFLPPTSRRHQNLLQLEILSQLRLLLLTSDSPSYFSNSNSWQIRLLVFSWLNLIISYYFLLIVQISFGPKLFLHYSFPRFHFFVFAFSSTQPRFHLVCFLNILTLLFNYFFLLVLGISSYFLPLISKASSLFSFSFATNKQQTTAKNTRIQQPNNA
jgi:hypothetical protein